MAPPRSTRQGLLVEEAVRGADGFRTAQDVYASLVADGARIGLTTVYRHLQRLADQGVLDVLTAADGQIAYRSCHSDGHHHHLVCRQCGMTLEIHEPSVEQWADRTAELAGFTDVTHTVEIFGTCATCRQP